MIMLMATSKPDQDIKIHITRDFRDIKFKLTDLRKLIKIICDRFGTNEYNNTNASANKYEISIVIVDDIEFEKINHRFLGRKSISDCLSFDLSDSNEADSLKHFELVINGQMALRQSALRGHSDEAELALYMTHALLHNFGFDDREPAMARNMHEQEDEILQELGYGLVYNKRMDSSETRNMSKRKNKK